MDGTKVLVIGNYLEPLERPLRNRGVFFEKVISSCSPFAMAGNAIQENMAYCDKIDHMPTLLNLRKNLSQMLSRDTENFCQNYNLQPLGTEVLYKNSAEYIIIFNSNVGYSLFEKNGVVYSDIWPQNDFTAELKSNSTYKRHNFPFSDEFNWKFYYDKFIDTILSEYDSNHIILIKTNVAQWYMENQKIESFDSRAAEYRNGIEKMDNYFIERTNCLCVDELYNSIPPSKIQCAFPYAQISKYTYKRLTEDIVDIIINKNIEKYKTGILKSSNSFANYLGTKLSSDIIKANIDDYEFIQKNCVSFYDIKREAENGSTFFKNILKLKDFLNSSEPYYLSDYAKKLLNDSDKANNETVIELIELYTSYMKLNINEILAIYSIFECCHDKSKFKISLQNILQNSDCLPVNSIKNFIKKNNLYLNNYSGIQPDLKSVKILPETYIRVENNVYIVIDLNSEELLTIYETPISDSVDYREIINNGYVCPIEYADALCSNLEFYIERARLNNGQLPIKIKYETEAEFAKTLNYIDYCDILNNEKYELALSGSSYQSSDYSAICDLSFLFEDNVKICYIGNGFNDLLRLYAFAKKLEKTTGGKLYLDDTYCYYYKNIISHRVGFESVAKQNFADRLFSTLFSEKLLENYANSFSGTPREFTSMPNWLYRNGLKNLVFVKNNSDSKADCTTIIYNKGAETENVFEETFYNIFSYNGLTYFGVFAYLDDLMTSDFNIFDYIEFTPFQGDKNAEIQDSMLSCDAVVINIRRGDYVKFVVGNQATSDEGFLDYNFYIEAIKRLLEIPDYPNKKYFVFSDDIPWAKAHTNLIGLDLVGDAEIVYIDHNTGSNSYKDMQLMMNGKIMIISQSGFARTAALLSERCEVLASLRGRTKGRFEAIGKKYKYDLEPLPRSRFKNTI